MALQGKTFVVTGAASGIGAATVRQLAGLGATIIGVDRHPAENVDLSLIADLRDPDAIDEVIASIPTGLNGLANIAGLPPSSPPGDVLKVNLRGLQRLTLGLIPHMAEGASIVNMVSSAGNRWPQLLEQVDEFESVSWDDIPEFARRQRMEVEGASYFFSKGALLVWTMKNRATWLDRGIRMNAVSPGPIDTPILQDFLDTLGPRAQRSLEATDRLGTPEDIAPVVVFMLSDGSAWFRGANVTPDGGLWAHMQLREHGLE